MSYTKAIYEKCPWCMEPLGWDKEANGICTYCKGAGQIFIRSEPTEWVSEAVFPKSPWDEAVEKPKKRWVYDVAGWMLWFAIAFWPLWLMLAWRITL